MQKQTNETIGNEAALREALEIITMGNELANYRKTVTEIYKLMLFVPSNELAECTKTSNNRRFRNLSQSFR